MRLAFVLPLIAACGSAPPPHAGATPIAPRAPATPPPKIEFDANAFHTVWLPVVARAGELAVLAVHDSDGGRGNPNLRVEVRDRNDKIVETLPVMAASEYDTLVVDGKPTPALANRIAGVNAELAKLHGVHDLVPMAKLDPIDTAGDDLRHMCTGDGFDVDFRGGQLAVFRHNSQRPLVERETAGWQAPARVAAGESCSNPAYLAAAYHARGVNTVVVEIGYRGTDICWEPGDAFHVVTW